jgi:hypothetical protein
MDREPIGIFVLTMRAVAGPANTQPDGRRYDLLVFARADTEDDAGRVAAKGLEDLGWIDREILRCGEIVDAGAVPPDLESAMRNALRHGCAVIVYDEP